MARYEVRFANGFWRIFDTKNYTTVSAPGGNKDGLFERKVDADEDLRQNT